MGAESIMQEGIDAMRSEGLTPAEMHAASQIATKCAEYMTAVTRHLSDEQSFRIARAACYLMLKVNEAVKNDEDLKP